MLSFKTLWRSGIARGGQCARTTRTFTSRTFKTIKTKMQAKWHSTRSWFGKHVWLSRRAFWYLASIITAIALLYSILPYSVNRKPGVVEMLVNTLNLVPFIHIDMAEAYNQMHIWIGRAFDAVLVVFAILFVLFIRQVIMDIKKGRPETSKHTEPLSIETMKQLITALNSVSEVLVKYVSQQEGKRAKGDKDGK